MNQTANGKTALVEAIEHGHYMAAAFLLKQGAKPDNSAFEAKNNQHRNLFEQFMEAGEALLAYKFLKKSHYRYSLAIKNANGDTLPHIYIRENKFEMLADMVTRGRMDWQVKNNKGETLFTEKHTEQGTLLHQAARAKHGEVILKVFKANPSAVNFTLASPTGETAFGLCASHYIDKEGNVDIEKLFHLLSNSTEIIWHLVQDYQKKLEAHPPYLSKWIAVTQEVEIRWEKSCHLAVYLCYLMDVLLSDLASRDRKKNIFNICGKELLNLSGNSDTPLYNAVNQLLEVISLALKDSKTGKTKLHELAEANDVIQLIELVSKGGNLTTWSDEGESALTLWIRANKSLEDMAKQIITTANAPFFWRRLYQQYIDFYASNNQVQKILVDFKKTLLTLPPRECTALTFLVCQHIETLRLKSKSLAYHHLPRLLMLFLLDKATTPELTPYYRVATQRKQVIGMHRKPVASTSGQVVKPSI